jgi:hypothetical protein
MLKWVVAKKCSKFQKELAKIPCNAGTSAKIFKMSQITKWYLLLLLVFGSCESASDKVGRMRRELIDILSEKEYFEFTVDQKTVKWQLPPTQELAKAKMERMLHLREELNQIPTEKLNEERKLQLAKLKEQLTQLVENGKGGYFDPTQLVLDPFFDKTVSEAELRSYLPHLYGYYSEVEQRWLPPEAGRAKLAVKKSLMVLDALEAFGPEADSAKLAVKDFIGLCQSAVLD